MRKLVLAALALLAGLIDFSAGSVAAELVMFDDRSCGWCRRWDAEVAPSYARSAEGMQAPLRRLKISDQSRAGFALASPVTGTPTFVLVRDGQEVGRIPGYLKPELFDPRLAELLSGKPASAPAGSPAPRSSLGDLMRKTLPSSP